MKKTFLMTLFTALFISIITQKCLATSAPKVSDQRQKMIDYALTLKGIQYKYAGKTPETGFDCSGFVSHVANYGAGILIPPSSTGIYNQVEIIEEKNREPGDLMFFKTTSSGKISHVGIYLGIYEGEGKYHNKRIFIHAASDGPETGVIISAIDESYWKKHFEAWGRILPPTM